ncbi:hypothetical protein E1298_39270 [Actinomadura rubrisoli]|uniref:Uncharacterized protein n=1 Tax=Actinomadura rubrisoli TaxID=2530368 RepID=A0A4R5A6B0_9ACTN|nr:hypothetical protein E1298_39270 [Actinomadura rubrisoli]
MIRFFDRQFAEEYETYLAVEMRGDGLHARFDDLTLSVWDDETLADFLDGLVADFRGWTGQRTWRINHLTLNAAFQSGGHVSLGWTLQRWLTRADSWQATLTTWIEAGEELAALASDVRAFVTHS